MKLFLFNYTTRYFITTYIIFLYEISNLIININWFFFVFIIVLQNYISQSNY